MKQRPTVLVFPAWTSNPFLNLLALAPTADGFQFVNRVHFTDLLTDLRQLRAGDICHIHWTSPIAQDAGSIWAARKNVARFGRVLRAAKARGVKLIWTVHNAAPHELLYPGVEQSLYVLLSELVHAIHIMAPATRELVIPMAHLERAKLVTIPHPSYVGVYDTGLSRAEARASFDLTDDEHAILFFGQIRPYKGIDTLLRTMARVRREDGSTPVLMLAGATSATARQEIEQLAPAGIRMISDFHAIPDEDVARWFLAADVAVFPYAAILNSGSAHLAATFRTPVVLPGLPHLREQLQHPWMAFFDPVDTVSSLTAVLSDASLFANLDERAFDEFNRDISPWTTSQRYLGLLQSLAVS